jgi:hypothetical protein
MAHTAESVGWFEAIGSFYRLLKYRSDADLAAPRYRRHNRRAREVRPNGPASAGKDSRLSSRMAREVGGYDLMDFAPA